ncbi:hypothetical protein FA15DRAFT_569331, partial [Coprinopsis marcescibilis]
CPCIFQPFHIRIHMHWFGSIRLGSQSMVERSIGEVSHKINGKKETFAEMTNIIVE